MLTEESREKLSALLHEEAALLFQKEPELKHTIQTFIEHNSNMSLTSKNCICTATVFNIGLINLRNARVLILRHIGAPCWLISFASSMKNHIKWEMCTKAADFL